MAALLYTLLVAYKIVEIWRKIDRRCDQSQNERHASDGKILEWGKNHGILSKNKNIGAFVCNLLDWYAFQVQFLVKAVNILCESRKQLMFTYIFAYYIEDHNQKIIFEANQSDLETATEALSQYLERNITKDNIEEITTNVMDKSRWDSFLNTFQNRFAWRIIFLCRPFPLWGLCINFHYFWLIQLLWTSTKGHAGAHFRRFWKWLVVIRDKSLVAP